MDQGNLVPEQLKKVGLTNLKFKVFNNSQKWLLFKNVIFKKNTILKKNTTLKLIYLLPVDLCNYGILIALINEHRIYLHQKVILFAII